MIWSAILLPNSGSHSATASKQSYGQRFSAILLPNSGSHTATASKQSYGQRFSAILLPNSNDLVKRRSWSAILLANSGSHTATASKQSYGQRFCCQIVVRTLLLLVSSLMVSDFQRFCGQIAMTWSSDDHEYRQS